METNIIEKSNTLNSFMNNANENMTLNELRFFCMYLSRLNAREPNKRAVEIPISDFEKLFDVELNTTDFTKKIQKIAGRTVKIKENDEIMVLTLYSAFCWSEKNANTIRIICNDMILPYIFELQKNYTSYRLGNIAKLSSITKIRLYEIMKQYEKLKEIRIEVEELKKMIMSKESDFRYFKIRVLDPAIKDINEYTDITVTYEKILKCRKCVALKFKIEGKETEKLIEQKENTNISVQTSDEPKTLEDLYRKYFTSENEKNFRDNIRMLLGDIYETEKMINRRTEAIYKQSVVRFKMQSQKTDIKNPVSYMQGIIHKIIDEEVKNPADETGIIKSAEVERLAINYKEIEEIENIEKGIAPEPSEMPSDKPKEKQMVNTMPEQEKPSETITEPVTASDDYNNTDDKPYNEFFKTMQEETELGMKAIEIIKNVSNYNDTIKFLDIVDKRWRNLDGFCRNLVLEELAKKENAPELIVI